eukprot:510484-Pyramimonas_sp.AAC.1
MIVHLEANERAQNGQATKYALRKATPPEQVALDLLAEDRDSVMSLVTFMSSIELDMARRFHARVKAVKDRLQLLPPGAPLP